MPPKVVQYHGAELYPKQRAAMFDPSRITCIAASTKSGKSSSALAWIFEQLVVNGQKGREFWWVSPTYAQSKIMWERLQLSLEDMKGNQARSLFKPNQTELSLTFINGARIMFKSGERCYDEQTEILTDQGWKYFSDLDRSESVMTLNLEAMEAEWQLPTNYLDKPYSGKMLAFRSEKVDLLVTPEHRFPVVSRSGEILGLKTIAEMGDHDRIPRRVGWGGYDIPELTEDECAMMGIFLAEGSAAGCSGGTTALAGGNYTVNFTQSPGKKGGEKGDVRSELKALLLRLGYNVNETPEGMLVRNKELWLRLSVLGNRYVKYIPDAYKNLPPEKLRVLLHWMVLGDGTYHAGRIIQYFTVSPRLADDVQEVAIKAGLSATITEQAPAPGGINAKGRQIHGRRTIYRVTFHIGEYDYIKSTTRRYVSEVQGYDGRIYCVTVPNHVVLVRRHGRIAWSGNSNDLYGQDVWACVIDEASRVRVESWYAIRSTLTYTQGPVRMIGNVIGRKDWFYELCRQAEMGAEGMAFHRITCWDAIEAGVLDREEIESAKRDFERLGKLAIWEQLYLAVATDDSTNPFGLEAIRACLIPDPARPGAYVEVKMMSDGSFEWTNPKAGWPIAGGVDVAGRGSTVVNPSDSEGDRAYTAICLLDAQGTVAYLARFRLPHAETEERIARTVGRVKTLVDATGMGDATVEALQRRGTLRVEGFLFNESSRQDLLEGLNLVIGNTQIHFPDGPLRAELEAFELDYRQRGVRYTVQNGHDDLAFALALAVRGLPLRGAWQLPIGIPSADGSLWLSQMPGAQEDAYWRKQRDDPLKAGLATQPGAAVPVPFLVGGSGKRGGKWSGP